MAHSEETTPLLDTPQNAAHSTEIPDPKSSNPLWTVLSLSVVMLILDVSGYIAMAPETAILEDIACSKYYNRLGHGNPLDTSNSGRCKIEPIQSEVALLNGWKDALETIPGILCALPYGALADRIGRKKVLLLSLVGCFLSDTWIRMVCWFPDTFPLRAIWFSGLWEVLGGGATTMSSMLYVMVADVCPAHKRTTAFSQINAAFLVSEFLSVPIGAALMSIDPWVPYLGASVIFIAGFCLTVFLVPETFSSTNKAQPDSLIDEAAVPLPHDGPVDRILSCSNHIGQALDQLRDAGRWIKQNEAALLVISSFFAAQLGKQVVGVLLQYASKRFNWTYAKTSFLISLRAGVSLVVLTTLIPTLSDMFSNRLKADLAVKDKRLTQISGVCLILGSVITFLASSPTLLIVGQIMFALGYAFAVTARSLVTSLVKQRQLGTIYTGISAMTYCGMFVGGPLLASSFSWGMRLGGVWSGLPFLIAAGLFMLATVAITAASVHIKKGIISVVKSTS